MLAVHSSTYERRAGFGRNIFSGRSAVGIAGTSEDETPRARNAATKKATEP